MKKVVVSDVIGMFNARRFFAGGWVANTNNSSKEVDVVRTRSLVNGRVFHLTNGQKVKVTFEVF